MIRIKFEPRDLWLGVYWNVEKFTQAIVTASGTWQKTVTIGGGTVVNHRTLKVYVCLIPCVPIIFTFKLKTPPSATAAKPVQYVPFEGIGH